MKKISEIVEITDNEFKHPDTQYDINDPECSRATLWKSAFKLGYQMGQYQISSYEDLP